MSSPINRLGIEQRHLLSLLRALEWKGPDSEFISWLPHTTEALSSDQVRDLLLKLGYVSDLHSSSLDTVPTSDLPALAFLPDGGTAIIKDHYPDGPAAYVDGKAIEMAEGGKFDWLELQPRPSKPPQRGIWFRELLSHYSGSLVAVMVLSLINAVLGLAMPLFTMSVYDFLIPSGSLGGLITVGLGALIALTWIVVANRLRAKVLSRLAANINYQAGRSLYSKLIGAPSDYIIPSTAFQNMARVRDIDRVREMIGGNMAASLFDAPFIFVALIAIAWLSGPLVLVPLLGIVIYLILTVYFDGYLNQVSSRAGRVSQRTQEQTRQALDGLDDLRESNTHSAWLQRFAQDSIRAARANFKFRMANALQQTIGKQLGMLIALSTLVTGIFMVFAGNMTAGGLIAAMMLIWRVTGPLQMAFFSATKIKQFRQSLTQLNAIMDTPWEQPIEKQFSALGDQQPSFKVDRLVYRFAADRDAALNGISFEVKAGQKVAIVGPNGSGKSTLLACFAGVLRPQAGSIQIDGHDIRQFSAIDYRRRVAYLGRDNDFVEGTIRDNLIASAPLATENEMHAALEAFAVDEFLEAHHDGLDTQLLLNGQLLVDINIALGIRLARVSLRDPDVYLLDDIYEDGDHPVMVAARNFLETLPECKTLIYATHDKDLMLKADIAIILESGTVAQVAELNQEETDSGEAA